MRCFSSLFLLAVNSERFQMQKILMRGSKVVNFIVTRVICAFLTLERGPENNFNSSSYRKWSIDIICLEREKMPLHYAISISHKVYGHTVVLDSNMSTEFLTKLAWCCGWWKFLFLECLSPARRLKSLSILHRIDHVIIRKS